MFILKIRKNILKLVLVALMLAPAYAEAVSYKVIAIVNGESISNIQLRDRVNIIINSSGLPKNDANKRKVATEAYDILINEILQAQEAKEKGVDLPEDQLQGALKDLEQRNNIPPGKFKEFIESKGLSYQATVDQIKAGLLWKKTISRIFKSDVDITDAEIDAKAREYDKKDVRKRVNISEIVIPVEYDQEDESYIKALEISKRANAGEDFAELAKKHSAGKTGSSGGHVGWMEEYLVMPPLNEEVAKLKDGQVGEPIRVDEMYVILKLNERQVTDPSKNREALKEKVLIEKLENQAKKYVKGLRQKAYIEKRFKPEELLDLIK